jgi:hypothetical protein
MGGRFTQEQVDAVLRRGSVTIDQDHGLAPPRLRDAIAEAQQATKVRVALSERKDHKKLNKMERAFLAVLELRHPKVWVQEFTLKLGDDCRYTPDFVCLTKELSLTVYETKGFMRDDALVKLKTAARNFPIFQFVLVEKKKGEWIEKEIAA